VGWLVRRGCCDRRRNEVRRKELSTLGWIVVLARAAKTPGTSGKKDEMKTLKASLLPHLAASAVLLSLCAAPALAQTAVAAVHGHVTNPVGQNFSNGTVKFTKDKTSAYKDEKFLNTVEIDKDGNYKVSDVAPGDYYVYVIQGDKLIDRLDLKVKAGDDATLNFDMTRPEFVNAMTPEEKKALEAYKAKNSEVVNANKVIASLNATLKTVRADLDAAKPTKADVSKDVTSMKQATDAKPDAGILWLTYGDTLQAQGEHLAAADKAAGKTAETDDDVKTAYSDAVEAYKKAVTLESAGAKPNLAEQGVAYSQMGSTLGRLGKDDDAVAAFDNAAKADPAGAGRYYKNEAIVLFNAGKIDGALEAANKAIAADPNQADAYYIKGQALVTKVTVDPKTNKLTPPPGCVDAYQKFLELEPNDPKAAQVKEVLASLGEKIDTKYKAGKK
jgi:tetratricopeptide (TPR) repeat protein